MIHLSLALLACSTAPSLPQATEEPGTAAPAKARDVSRPPADEEVARAVEGAIAYLLAHQEQYSGDPPVGRIPGDVAEWQAAEVERLAALRAEQAGGREWPYEGVYRVGPRGHIPSGYRVGGTAIVCLALIGAPGYASSEASQAAVHEASRFLADRIANDADMEAGPKEGYDVRGWGHAYALRFYLQALRTEALADAALAQLLESQIPHLIHCLAVNEEDGGGWNYAGRRASPFMTASTLLTLFAADDAGYPVDAGLLERSLDALEAGRTEIGSFAYAGAVRSPVAMPGSAARSAISELALHRAGRSSPERLRVAVLGFFEGWKDLLVRKSEQGTHVGDYGIAPYYFFFGHTYVALAIEHLPPAERAMHRAELRRLLWSTRDGDGSWNDRVFPRTASYSTAMVVLALLAPESDPVPLWVTGSVPARATAGD